MAEYCYFPNSRRSSNQTPSLMHTSECWVMLEKINFFLAVYSRPCVQQFVPLLHARAGTHVCVCPHFSSPPPWHFWDVLYLVLFGANSLAIICLDLAIFSLLSPLFSEFFLEMTWQLFFPICGWQNKNKQLKSTLTSFLLLFCKYSTIETVHKNASVTTPYVRQQHWTGGMEPFSSNIVANFSTIVALRGP